jgi:TolB protein
LIAFTAGVGGGFQIALYDASKGGAEIITSGGGDAIEPAWLNDGRHLVFTKRAGGRTRLMILDTVSKQVRALHVPSFGDASSASFVY